MGIIKDTIKSAIAPDTVNNGLGGPSLPFMPSGQSNHCRASSGHSQRGATLGSTRPQYYQPPVSEQTEGPYFRSRCDFSSDQGSPSFHEDPSHQEHHNGLGGLASGLHLNPYSPGRRSRSTNLTCDYDPDTYDGGPDQYSQNGQLYRHQDYDSALVPQDTEAYNAAPAYSHMATKFRPFVLPQIAYGPGQPFLRAYSDELSVYGIYQQDFLGVLDALNVANVPNPENQIFQKGANIAGWFVPGAAGFALIGGQLVTGIGTAYGHMSALAKVLSAANMDLFLPRGLEICICSTQHVEIELGCAHPPHDINARPEQRVWAYGELAAPLTSVLPKLERAGRRDAVASVARGLTSMGATKSLQKAQKDAADGKMKESVSLEKTLKWIMVRQASHDALSYMDSRRSPVRTTSNE